MVTLKLAWFSSVLPGLVTVPNLVRFKIRSKRVDSISVHLESIVLFFSSDNPAEDYNQLGQKHGRHRIAVLLLEHRELTLGLLEATNLICELKPDSLFSAFCSHALAAMPYLVAARDGEFQLQYDKLGDMEVGFSVFLVLLFPVNFHVYFLVLREPSE